MRKLTKNERSRILRQIVGNAGGNKHDVRILSGLTDNALRMMANNARVSNEGDDMDEGDEYLEGVTNEDEEEEEETENEEVPPQFKKEEEEVAENEEEEMLEEEETENEGEEEEEEEEVANSDDELDPGGEELEAGKEGLKSPPAVNRRRNSFVRPTANAKRFLNAIPREYREVLVNAQRIVARDKAKYVKTIIANSRFKKGFLMKKPVEELKEMARVLNARSRRRDGSINDMFSTDFSGMSAPVGNSRLSRKEEAEDILMIPTINWAAESKKRQTGKKNRA